MLLSWDKIRDHHALILCDLGATYNFILEDLARTLGIKIEELGRALHVDQIFEGVSMSVTPLIGKLRVHI